MNITLILPHSWFLAQTIYAVNDTLLFLPVKKKKEAYSLYSLLSLCSIFDHLCDMPKLFPMIIRQERFEGCNLPVAIPYHCSCVHNLEGCWWQAIGKMLKEVFCTNESKPTGDTEEAACLKCDNIYQKHRQVQYRWLGAPDRHIYIINNSGASTTGSLSQGHSQKCSHNMSLVQLATSAAWSKVSSYSHTNTARWSSTAH